MTDGSLACGSCGAAGGGNLCSQCGAPLTLATGQPGHALRAEAVETRGFDRRLLATLRDLLVRPVRVVRAQVAGDRRVYLPPLKLFVVLGASRCW